MQILRSVIIGSAIVTLYFGSQPMPESTAADRLSYKSVTVKDNAVTVVLPRPEGIHLAKSAVKEDPSGEDDNWTYVGSSVISSGSESTKVIIRGNSVLVPVTLVYGNNEVNVHLLLDTGATGTAINAQIADQLSINLSKAKKTRVQVVGGAVIEANIIRMNSLTVGPHTSRDWDIFVVPHRGSVAKSDGLLGMDILRGLKYRVDFKKQVIIWE